MIDDELMQPEISSDADSVEKERTSDESPAQVSRIDRLKRKLKKLQGKDPDIYPMW